MEKINFKILNNNELITMFRTFNSKEQKQVIYGGFRSAGQIILKQAKSNFESVKKGKSKTNYLYANKSFKIEPTKKGDNISFKVGVRNYKLHWIEWGTDERKYISKKGTEHRIGKIQPTHFFYNAVESKKTEAENVINDNIIKSMERVVKRHQKGKL